MSRYLSIFSAKTALKKFSFLFIFNFNLIIIMIKIFVSSLEGSTFMFSFNINSGTMIPVFNTHDHIGKITGLSVD